MSINEPALVKIFQDICPHARNIRVVANGRGVMLWAELENAARTYFVRGRIDQALAERQVKEWAAKFNGTHQRKAS